MGISLMVHKYIKRWTPDAEVIRAMPGLRFLGRWLENPYLFHLNRHSVSIAFLVGLFFCYIPSPGQAIMAAGGALILRGNLPISVALVWVSNPFTFPFFALTSYGAGAWIMGVPMVNIPQEWSFAWFATLWQPFLLGSVVMGLIAGGLGYLFIQLVWRWSVASRWKQRNKRVAKN